MGGRQRVGVIAVVVAVMLAAVYLRAQYVPTTPERHLIEAAERWDLPVEDVGPWFSAWTLGDGQVFAIIASDPLGFELGEGLKDPGYRFSRVGYSWLTWIVIGGQPHLIPYGMALVGGLAVIGVLLTAIILRERLGPQVWFLVLNPALYIGFAGDTTEPLAILALSLALASNNPWAGVAVGMSRPDYLLATLGRWRALTGGAIAGAVVAAYGAWRFGFDTLLPAVGHISPPFSGYLEHSTPAGWLLALLAVVTGIIGAWHRNWTWVAVALFVLCFAPVITEAPVNAWRAAGVLPVLWAFGPQLLERQASAVAETSPLARAA